MIPAIHRAKAHYQLQKCEIPFEQDLFHYLRYGYVVSRPDLFIMGKTMWCDPTKEPKTVDDLVSCQEKGKANVWYFRMLVGNPRDAAKLLPFPLEWMCFSRHYKKEIRRYRLKEIMDKLT